MQLFVIRLHFMSEDLSDVPQTPRGLNVNLTQGGTVRVIMDKVFLGKFSWHASKQPLSPRSTSPTNHFNRLFNDAAASVTCSVRRSSEENGNLSFSGSVQVVGCFLGCAMCFNFILFS